ncbi:glycoside hydrolase family 5 protein, partial [Dothistroma septosporum NZE10]
VNYITRRSSYAMIVPHNYGRYDGNIITNTDDFKTFWRTVALEVKDNERVIFDTNNEGWGQAIVFDIKFLIHAAAIDGIRSAGATSQYITVEGNTYTGAWAVSKSRTNANTMGNLTDPQNKLIYQMHQYLDCDGSGTSETYVSKTIGSEMLELATQWLKENGKTGLIGEFACAVNDICEDAVEDMLSCVQTNSDVRSGALWCAAGPWWADYMLSVAPTDASA